MRRFFTLVELLVVIGIIAMLASLLLPALNVAKIMAKKTACANNLRQLAVAGNYYASDYGEWFFNWRGTLGVSSVEYWNKTLNLLGYLPQENGGVLYCPGSPYAWNESYYNRDNYAFNGNLGTWYDYGFRARLGMIKRPSDIAFFSDSGYRRVDSGMRCGQVLLAAEVEKPDGSVYAQVGYVHRNFCNVGYVDGHTGDIKAKNAKKENWYDGW